MIMLDLGTMVILFQMENNALLMVKGSHAGWWRCNNVERYCHSHCSSLMLLSN